MSGWPEYPVSLSCAWSWTGFCGRLTFIHLQGQEGAAEFAVQLQYCSTILHLKGPRFFTVLVLNCQEGTTFPALEAYKNQFSILEVKGCNRVLSLGTIPQRRAPAEWNLRELFCFSHRFWREILVKFFLAHANPGKRSTENFTKISRQISRHLWQRKTEKIITSALQQGSCSDNPRVEGRQKELKC